MVGTWVLESDGQSTVPTLLLSGFVIPGNKVCLYTLVTLSLKLYSILLDYRSSHRHASGEFLTLPEALNIHLGLLAIISYRKNKAGAITKVRNICTML